MGQPRSWGGKTEAETSHFALSIKEVKQHGNSQSIYFVTGGVFEMDKIPKKQRSQKCLYRECCSLILIYSRG